jgi:hypothetical protein
MRIDSKAFIDRVQGQVNGCFEPFSFDEIVEQGKNAHTPH